MTQAELGARAGVSRQLVAAVETRRNVPAVDAAIGLAGALATTVEELFAPEDRHDVVAALGDPLPDGALLRVGRVADRLVATELADHGAAGGAWARPDAVLDTGSLRLFPGAQPAGLVLAGCDPALGLAESMLDGLGSRRLLAISAASGIALRALAHGRVHAAVVHGPPGSLPHPPVDVVRWHLARWQVGLATAPRLRARSPAALLHGATPVVQREPEAASQQALERARRAAEIDVLPRGPRAPGHLQAARIAAERGWAAVTTESAASAFGLRFLPLEDHVVEIWIDERWVDHPAVGALGELLAAPAFTQRVARIGGYDLTDCGARAHVRRADLARHGRR